MRSPSREVAVVIWNDSMELLTGCAKTGLYDCLMGRSMVSFANRRAVRQFVLWCSTFGFHIEKSLWFFKDSLQL